MSSQFAASHCFIKEVSLSLYKFNSGLLGFFFLQNRFCFISASIWGLRVKITSAKWSDGECDKTGFICVFLQKFCPTLSLQRASFFVLSKLNWSYEEDSDAVWMTLELWRAENTCLDKYSRFKRTQRGQKHKTKCKTAINFTEVYPKWNYCILWRDFKKGNAIKYLGIIPGRVWNIVGGNLTMVGHIKMPSCKRE